EGLRFFQPRGRSSGCIRPFFSHSSGRVPQPPSKKGTPMKKRAKKKTAQRKAAVKMGAVGKKTIGGKTMAGHKKQIRRKSQSVDTVAFSLEGPVSVRAGNQEICRDCP